MGSHRAEGREPTPPRSEHRPQEYVGRRIAGRSTPSATSATPSTYVGRRAARPAEDTAPALVATSEPLPFLSTVELPTLSTLSTSIRSTTDLRPAQPGKRRAVKAPTRRGALRVLPPVPVLAGVATLAIAIGGVVTSAGDAQLAASSPRMSIPNAATGQFGSGTYDALGRSPVVSRDSDRDALGDATGTDLSQEAEVQAAQRNEAIGQLAQQAEREAHQIKLNAWGLPVEPGAYHLTAGFGDCSGLWSHCHTGLDFAAPTGTPIHAIANGTVTSVGYEGAYGNQTIVTLDDGTEIWYCHQNEFAVSVGDRVTIGEVIGYVGSTGNTTGPHVHVEVRPGGGDPVDPYEALVAHGVQP
ncbi:M23 family metallopeptidase [Nocardioides panacisoli]|uniref:M23ase beta-sheet core domain-containing protein n=1 Tax=Nocardioides panacisoli TaxID=627624 RepID=A0ABP7IFZ1_9ACTN